MGRDQSEDDEEGVTEIDVDLDPSLVTEITITRAGVAPISVWADTASPADSEPTTLEPQLGVRGLGSQAAPSSSSPPPPTLAAGRRRDSEAEAEAEDEDEERTTQNIDASVYSAFERALREAGPAAPATQLSPIIMTPSEPIRLEDYAGLGPKGRRPAPIPAAGRPPEEDGETGPSTARRGPARTQPKGVATAIADDPYEQETGTDKVQPDIVAAVRGPSVTLPLITADEDAEAEETRTIKAPLTLASEQAIFMTAPRRELVGIDVSDQAHPTFEAQAAAGATVRMFFDPATGKATLHPESDPNAVAAQRPMQPFGEQPTVQAMPIQPYPAHGAPVAVVNDASLASLDATRGTRKKPRRLGRFVLLFLVAAGATGAGVHYRHQLEPWIMARVPVGWRGTSAAPVPSTPDVADPGAVPSAVSLTAPSIATPATSASASPSASASASAKKRVPPRR